MERGRRKTKIGNVVSDKMDKSIVVSVERLIRHPLYKKYFKNISKRPRNSWRMTKKIGARLEIK